MQMGLSSPFSSGFSWGNSKNNHRHPELEGTRKEHWAQPLAPYGTTQTQCLRAVSQYSLSSGTEQSRTTPSLTSVAVLGMVYPRVWLALLATRAYCQLGFNLLSVNQNPQIPFYRAVFQPLVPPSVYLGSTAPPQVGNPSLAPVKLTAVGNCPSLQSVKISLRGPSTYRGVSSSS